MVDAGLFSAGAALVGAAIGGSMSFLGSWIVQQKEVHAQWVGQDRLRRQELYNEFIQQASKCYADALQHQILPDVPSLVIAFCIVRSAASARFHLLKSWRLPSRC